MPVQATMLVYTCYRKETVSALNFTRVEAEFVRYEEKVSIYANVMARNLAQCEGLSNTFTYKISLIIHETTPCKQLCWFMLDTARRLFVRLT